MATTTIGIILHGATGRICSTQHIANALVPIRDEGGLTVGSDRIVPRLVLAGRNAERLSALAKIHRAEWTTDLDKALKDPAFGIFFDAAATYQRQTVLEQAIAAGKHIYCEKPVAMSGAEARKLLQLMESRGLKHAAVEDKLYLPGLAKLARLAASDYFGRVTGFHIEFGWWVFDGSEAPCQRPSWNYQRSNGGGLVLDMFPHWRYVIERLIGCIRCVMATMSTATTERIDERGQQYTVDVEDTAHALVQLKSGAIGTISSSWATRVRRDDLLTIQIDGSKASAIAGLHRCWTQTATHAPRTAHFSIATDLGVDYRNHWIEVLDGDTYKNPYRVGWETFLTHVVADTPMQANFAAGIRDLDFVEACYRSAREKSWINLA